MWSIHPRLLPDGKALALPSALVSAGFVLFAALASVASPMEARAATRSFGSDAVNVAHLLLQPQLSGCVAKWNRQQTMVTRVIQNRVRPDYVYTRVHGDLLEGDIILGTADLQIWEREVNDGGEPYKTYVCRFSKRMQ